VSLVDFQSLGPLGGLRGSQTQDWDSKAATSLWATEGQSEVWQESQRDHQSSFSLIQTFRSPPSLQRVEGGGWRDGRPAGSKSGRVRGRLLEHLRSVVVLWDGWNWVLLRPRCPPREDDHAENESALLDFQGFHVFLPECPALLHGLALEQTQEGDRQKDWRWVGRGGQEP